MHTTPSPDPQLHIFTATMRAVRGPAEQPVPDAPRVSKDFDDITVELPRFNDPQRTNSQPAESAPAPLSRGRHRM